MYLGILTYFYHFPFPGIFILHSFQHFVNPLPYNTAICSKQFLLFSQCFLPFIVLIFHFQCTLKCCLQFFFFNLNQSEILSFGNGLKLLFNFLFWCSVIMYLLSLYVPFLFGTLYQNILFLTMNWKTALKTLCEQEMRVNSIQFFFFPHILFTNPIM